MHKTVFHGMKTPLPFDFHLSWMWLIPGLETNWDYSMFRLPASRNVVVLKAFYSPALPVCVLALKLRRFEFFPGCLVFLPRSSPFLLSITPYCLRQSVDFVGLVEFVILVRKYSVRNVVPTIAGAKLRKKQVCRQSRKWSNCSHFQVCRIGKRRGLARGTWWQ